MAEWFPVIEGSHDIQNPTSAEKILLLGERLGLGPESHVLDLASGRGGPAVLLAGAFGCRVTGVEQAAEFVAAAGERARDAGVEELAEFIHGDARSFVLEPERFDAALCLGASFVWDGLSGTLDALRPAVRPRGFVVVGEPYWREWPVPEDFRIEQGQDFASLGDTMERLQDAGLELVMLIASSLDDWDRYESLHWFSAEQWLDAHPDDPDAAKFREMIAYFRDRYLRWQRHLLGWAILVGRRR